MASYAISPEDVNVVGWMIDGFAIVLTAGRLYIRGTTLHGLRGDDIAHLFATACMITQAALYSQIVPTLKEILAIGNGATGLQPDLVWYLQYSTITAVVFISGLWAVKLSFMLLYRYIFNVSKRFNHAWWMVMVFNIITYLVCIAGRLIACGKPQDLNNFDICTDPSNEDNVHNIFIFTFVSVVSSDLATMALPLTMVSGLTLKLSQKIQIAVILCLSFVTMAFETLRLVMSFEGGNSDNSLWQLLEMGVAVIVSALPPYWSVLTGRKEWFSRISHTYTSLFRGSSRGSEYRDKKNSFGSSTSGDTHHSVEQSDPRFSRCPVHGDVEQNRF